MNFLKKLSSLILRATGIVTGLQPMFSGNSASAAVASRVESELSAIAALVATAEVIGETLGTPGADKARAIGPLVAQEIMRSSFMLNKKIADPAKFSAACAAIGGDVADLLQSLHEGSADSTDKT